MITLEGFAIAMLGGAAIGLERQWSGHAIGPDARFGGIRTFTLLGALGGMAGGFALAGWIAVAAVVLGASSVLVIIGYAARSRQDIDATTEVAALVVLSAGTLAGAGQTTLASGIIALTALLLVEKSQLHTLVTKVDDTTLRASARFAALALVVLPLLPAGSYGPFGAVRPREVWALVLFFSGLSFAAWIARRMVGPTHGIVATGLLGGLISSTSVTLSFARASRAGRDAVALAVGTVGACTVMLVRVAIASAILNRPVAQSFAWYAWPSLVIGVLALALVFRKQDADGKPQVGNDSPLQLRAALQMAALFQGVLVVVSAAIAWWSLNALLVTSAMIGLTDVDALTLSLARATPDIAPELAGRALAVGVLSNTLLQLSVARVVGRGAYRPLVALALGSMAAAVAAALWLR